MIDLECDRFNSGAVVAMDEDIERLFRRSPQLNKENRFLILEQYGRNTKIDRMEIELLA